MTCTSTNDEVFEKVAKYRLISCELESINIDNFVSEFSIFLTILTPNRVELTGFTYSENINCGFESFSISGISVDEKKVFLQSRRGKYWIEYDASVE